MEKRDAKGLTEEEFLRQYNPDKYPKPSLTADILGANMAGIPSCWFNPKGKPLTGDARPDYEIRRLEELKGIL